MGKLESLEPLGDSLNKERKKKKKHFNEYFRALVRKPGQPMDEYIQQREDAATIMQQQFPRLA